MTKTAAFLLSLLALAACGDDDDPAPVRDDAGLRDAGDASTSLDGGTGTSDSGSDGGPGSAPDGGTSGGNTTDLKNAFGQKAVQCGLTTDAEDAASEAEADDAYDRCLIQCLIAADCNALLAVFCERPGSTAGVEACARACPLAPADGFACADGTKIPHSFACDGEGDCPDSSDETSCAAQCADGTPLASEALECDGKSDCADGSDERGCSFCM